MSKYREMIRLTEEKYNIFAREYQKEIIEESLIEIEQCLNKGIQASVLIESPTGSGKTFIGLMIVRILNDFYGEHFNSSNWCAMRRELLEQARFANTENFNFNNNINYVSLFASEIPSSDILVMDEAHHDSTFSGANVHKMSKSKLVIGLTATPLRSDQVDLYFVKKIKNANTQRLVDESFLMPYNLHYIEEWTLDLIVQSYLAKKDYFGQTIFFVKNQEECENLTLKLKEHNISVEYVHSGLGENLRDQYINDFKNKKLDCLVNVNILTEGFDYDDLQSVYCRPSQMALTKQMAGRALRLSNKFSCVNVIQSSDTLYKYSREVKPLNTFKFIKGQWEMNRFDMEHIQRYVDTILLKKMIATQKAKTDKVNKTTKGATKRNRLEIQLEDNVSYNEIKRAEQYIIDHKLIPDHKLFLFSDLLNAFKKENSKRILSHKKKLDINIHKFVFFMKDIENKEDLKYKLDVLGPLWVSPNMKKYVEEQTQNIQQKVVIY